MAQNYVDRPSMSIPSDIQRPNDFFQYVGNADTFDLQIMYEDYIQQRKGLGRLGLRCVVRLEVNVQYRSGHGLPNGGLVFNAVQGQTDPAQVGPSVQAVSLPQHSSDPGFREGTASAVNQPQRPNTSPVQRSEVATVRAPNSQERSEVSTVRAPTNQEQNALGSLRENAHPGIDTWLDGVLQAQSPRYQPSDLAGQIKERVSPERDWNDVSERNRELLRGSTSINSGPWKVLDPIGTR